MCSFLGKWGVVKLVESGKLESGVDKGYMREKKGRLKKKKTVKHEHGIVILLTFEFEQINRLLF